MQQASIQTTGTKKQTVVTVLYHSGAIAFHHCIQRIMRPAAIYKSPGIVLAAPGKGGVRHSLSPPWPHEKRSQQWASTILSNLGGAQSMPSLVALTAIDG